MQNIKYALKIIKVSPRSLIIAILTFNIFYFIATTFYWLLSKSTKLNSTIHLKRIKIFIVILQFICSGASFITSLVLVIVLHTIQSKISSLQIIENHTFLRLNTALLLLTTVPIIFSIISTRELIYSI
jgi:hypothetical protein